MTMGEFGTEVTGERFLSSLQSATTILATHATHLIANVTRNQRVARAA